MGQAFRQRLLELRKQRDWNQADVRRAIEAQFGRRISRSMYSKWESGKQEPASLQDVACLAKLYNVSANYVMGYEEENEYEGFKVIPLLRHIDPDVPISEHSYISEGVRKQFVPKEEEVDFCIKVCDNSMADKGIYSDDLAFVRQQANLKNGDIVCASMNGQTVVRSFYEIGEDILLLATDRETGRQIVATSDNDEIVILGKVVVRKCKII